MHSSSEHLKVQKWLAHHCLFLSPPSRPPSFSVLFPSAPARPSLFPLRLRVRCSASRKSGGARRTSSSLLLLHAHISWPCSFWDLRRFAHPRHRAVAQASCLDRGSEWGLGTWRPRAWGSGGRGPGGSYFPSLAFLGALLGRLGALLGSIGTLLGASWAVVGQSRGSFPS